MSAAAREAARAWVNERLDALPQRLLAADWQGFATLPPVGHTVQLKLADGRIAKGRAHYWSDGAFSGWLVDEVTPAGSTLRGDFVADMVVAWREVTA